MNYYPAVREMNGGKTLEDKLFTQSEVLSSNIIVFCRELKSRHVDSSTVHQLRRSGTAVFANVNESHGAQGRNDFVAKLHIALKECKECDGWLKLLRNTQSITQEEFRLLHTLCVNIYRILSCSIKTAKSNSAKQKALSECSLRK